MREMLERSSVGVGQELGQGSSQKSMLKSMRGNKKSLAFHCVISELRAELMGAKQHAPGHPCVLLWVRGDTIHVTEESVGQTVLSWSDTYFAQLVTLYPTSGGGFRTKECKFKVQQKGKTIAKTAVVDLAKYCSESGLAREQSVKVPLQPSGTLYFVVSTAPAAEHESAKSTSSNLSERLSSGPQLGSTSVGGFNSASVASASGTTSAVATPIVGGSGAGGNTQRTPSASVFSLGASQQGVAAALASVASVGAASVGAAASEDGDRERPSTSSGRLQKKHRLQNSISASKPLPEGENSGLFRRMARLGSKGAAAGAAAASAALAGAAGASSGGGSSVAHMPLRKYDSADLGSGGGASPSGAAAAVARLAAGSGGSVGGIAGLYSPARRGGLRSSACNGGLSSLGSATLCPDSANGGGGGADSVQRHNNFLRHSMAAASTSSSSDAVGAMGAGTTLSPKRAVGGGGAAAADGGGGGAGWGAWLRGGLGWGRTSNHSATGTSTTGAHSQASLHGPGGGGGEHDSSALETAIMEAAEPAELRDLALDMLHERDEWRSRALGAQDALGRAQTARASAVREAQRLEVRLREYMDELGRRTDGSLLQELVEAKVRIAELANENLRLRRQITHMGPLFYDDSGDEGAGGNNS